MPSDKKPKLFSWEHSYFSAPSLVMSNRSSTIHNLLYLVQNLPTAEVRAAAWAVSSAPFNAALPKVTTVDVLCICIRNCKLRKILQSCKHFSFLRKSIYIRQVLWLENKKKSLWIGFLWVEWYMCKKHLCQVLIWAQALLPACRMHCWKLNVLWTKAKEPWAAKTPFCCTKCRKLLFSNIKMTNHPLIKLWLIKSSNFCLIMLIFRHVKH